jgi:hypothetical protein
LAIWKGSRSHNARLISTFTYRIASRSPKQTAGASDSRQEHQERSLSDQEEFVPKPLTRKERLMLNVSVTTVVVAILVMGGFIMHYHVDPTSPYQTAAPQSPAKKI